MAKSAKAKKEAKKDFQKTKLKVGKTKPKNSNFTDTSFKARSISVLQQSLMTNAPNSSTQFSHHLSLLTTKNESQRAQSLSHLITALQAARQNGNTDLPQPASVIISKVQPLIRDSSSTVRSNALKLLQLLPDRDIKSHAESLLLWTRLGMTNLSSPIRISALDVLEWLCRAAGDEVVGCAGGWAKTLKCFAGILGWESQAAVASRNGKSAWTSTSDVSSKSTLDSKLLLRTLVALTTFLQCGLTPEDKEKQRAEDARVAAMWFPLTHTNQHMLPYRAGKSNPYGYLNLFGPPRDEEGSAYEDAEERSQYFDEKWQEAFETGARKVLGDGGGIGRAAVGLVKVIETAQTLREGADR